MLSLYKPTLHVVPFLIYYLILFSLVSISTLKIQIQIIKFTKGIDNCEIIRCYQCYNNIHNDNTSSTKNLLALIFFFFLICKELWWYYTSLFGSRHMKLYHKCINYLNIKIKDYVKFLKSTKKLIKKNNQKSD